MRIIVLFGHADCGKTESLNYLREMLRMAGRSLSQQPNSGDEPEAFQVGGKIVGVAPGGDTRLVVEANIRFFEQTGCDVGYTACRSKGGPNMALDEYYCTHNCGMEWVQKSNELELPDAIRDMCNKETAKVLMMKV